MSSLTCNTHLDRASCCSKHHPHRRQKLSSPALTATCKSSCLQNLRSPLTRIKFTFSQTYFNLWRRILIQKHQLLTISCIQSHKTLFGQHEACSLRTESRCLPQFYSRRLHNHSRLLVQHHANPNSRVIWYADTKCQSTSTFHSATQLQEVLILISSVYEHEPCTENGNCFF